MQDNFDTATRRPKPRIRNTSLEFLARNRAQVIVAFLVVLALFGGALYASRVSEHAPKVVYSASLEKAASESQAPLTIDINEADAEELDELPQIGPATAEAIVEFRLANGDFDSVEDLEEVPGIGPSKIEEIKPFATV